MQRKIKHPGSVDDPKRERLGHRKSLRDARGGLHTVIPELLILRQ